MAPYYYQLWSTVLSLTVPLYPDYTSVKSPCIKFFSRFLIWPCCMFPSGLRLILHINDLFSTPRATSCLNLHNLPAYSLGPDLVSGPKFSNTQNERWWDGKTLADLIFLDLLETFYIQSIFYNLAWYLTYRRHSVFDKILSYVSLPFLYPLKMCFRRRKCQRNHVFKYTEWAVRLPFHHDW